VYPTSAVLTFFILLNVMTVFSHIMSLFFYRYPMNAQLNPICHLLALLELTVFSMSAGLGLTLSNPIFLPPAYSLALIYFGRERGWITCNYPTVLKHVACRQTERVQPALSVG
jgi:hypothetical protein